MTYPQPIIDAVKALCKELKKHYPEAFDQTYDSLGAVYKDIYGATFEERMQMGVYIELAKAGILR